MKWLMAFFIILALIIGCKNENNNVDNNHIVPQNLVEITDSRKPVIGLVNVLRTQNKLEKVSESIVLNNVTSDYARLMAQSKSLSHQLNGTPEKRLKKYEYDWIWFGENIAFGQRNPEDVMASWENSVPHKKNMLDARAMEIGYSCWESTDGRYHCLIVAKPK